MTGTECLVTLAVCVVLWLAGSAVFRHHPRLRWWLGYDPGDYPVISKDKPGGEDDGKGCLTDEQRDEFWDLVRDLDRREKS